jgi:hypothetical protein
MAWITAPTFTSFCASSGIKQEALGHFDIGYCINLPHLVQILMQAVVSMIAGLKTK